MILFLRKLLGKCYSITRKGHSVYIVWLRRIEQWPIKDNENYLNQLRDTISQTVTEETWKLLQEHERHGDEWYNSYVEEVKLQLCKDFNLNMIDNEVTTGTYHGGMYVISFMGNKAITYPNYYRAIQLKPYFKEA